MSRALIVADDRPEAGNGHLVRCGALRAELLKRGWSCDWEPLTDQKAWYRRGGSPDVAIMDMQWQAGEAFHCGPVPTVVIVDTPRPAVDVLRDDNKAETAVLVCGSAGATEAMFRGFNTTKMLVGPEYSLLRPEFAAAKSDRSGLEGVLDIRRLEVRRIWLVEARTLAQSLASKAVCITYGGMRAMEAACVGAPMVVIPRNGGEKLNANGLVAAGAAVMVAEERAEEAAAKLLEDVTRLAAMSDAGRKLVDGLGVSRVADAVEGLVA